MNLIPFGDYYVRQEYWDDAQCVMLPIVDYCGFRVFDGLGGVWIDRNRPQDVPMAVGKPNPPAIRRTMAIIPIVAKTAPPADTEESAAVDAAVMMGLKRPDVIRLLDRVKKQQGCSDWNASSLLAAMMRSR